MSSPLIFDTLRREVRSLTQGAFVRLSRDPDTLFASDYPARGVYPNALWELYSIRMQGSTALLTPNGRLWQRLEQSCRMLCVQPDSSETGLWYRHYGRLLERLPRHETGDSAFLLALLRADGEAGLRKNPVLIRKELDRELALLQCRGPKGSRLSLALFGSLGSRWFPAIGEECPDE